MPAVDTPISVAEVLSALSFALDLTEGQTPGHAVRSCVIGMRLAQEMGLPLDAQSDLYYALLMKDAGCSANASMMMRLLGTDDIAGKRDAVAIDWTHTGWESIQYALSHVKTGAPFLERVRALFSMAVNQKQNAQMLNRMRCERGASIARRIGLSEGTAAAIQCLNEHWNGAGQPQGLRRGEIPLLSRIMNVAQIADVFHLSGNAEKVVKMRSGRWFDPDVARAFASVARRGGLWPEVENAASIVASLEPRAQSFRADDETLDNICLAFAEVIDAKSPFTYRHSAGVAGAAIAMAEALSLPKAEVSVIRRAALLHDIGKLSVPNTILDKPGKLTGEEWDVVRRHPYYSHQILKRVPGFGALSDIAASHHEKLDGSGYFRNLSGKDLGVPERILVVADIYDALAANRPYRDALPLETVFQIMGKDAPHALDASCFEALQYSADLARETTESLLNLNSQIEKETTVCEPLVIA